MLGLNFMKAISSGVEHLVYTEAVGGSNPSSPIVLGKLCRSGRLYNGYNLSRAVAGKLLTFKGV